MFSKMSLRLLWGMFAVEWQYSPFTFLFLTIYEVQMAKFCNIMYWSNVTLNIILGNSEQALQGQTTEVV